MEPIKDLIPRLPINMEITKRRLRKLEIIEGVRRDREQGSQDLAFNARPFVLCGLPLRRPPQDQLCYTRTNGKFFLEITAHPKLGLPYGQDRLVPIWAATLAVLQKNRTIRFNSPSQVLNYFELPKNGHHYKRIVHGFERIFGATIFFGTEEQREKDIISNWARFHFFDKMQLWYHRDENHPSLPGDDFANIIELSEAFYQEIQQHKIPVERKVVAALANAPGTLDLYVWLVWKSWTLKGNQAARVPLYGDASLQEQLGSVEYKRDRRFREKVSAWLREVKAWWPECPAAMSEDSGFLIIRSARSSPAIKAAQKPVDS
jgi:hypothetical protein